MTTAAIDRTRLALTDAAPPNPPDMPASLAEALAQLQADLPKVDKAETASVTTEKGRTYTYDYADLADVTEALMPRLSELGLSFSALPTLDDAGRFVLRYVLRHIKGEADGGDYPLPDHTRASPQAIGSAISYGRRYTLCAVTGLAPDKDDDGQAAAAKPKPARRSSPPVAAEPPSPTQGEETPPPPATVTMRRGNGAQRLMTSAQRRMLMPEFAKAGLGGEENRAARLMFSEQIIGRPLQSSNELTTAEASKLIDHLDKHGANLEGTS